MPEAMIKSSQEYAQEFQSDVSTFNRKIRPNIMKRAPGIYRKSPQFQFGEIINTRMKKPPPKTKNNKGSAIFKLLSKNIFNAKRINPAHIIIKLVIRTGR